MGHTLVMSPSSEIRSRLGDLFKKSLIRSKCVLFLIRLVSLYHRLGNGYGYDMGIFCLINFFLLTLEAKLVLS